MSEPPAHAYDVVVVGAGPGGIAAAVTAAEAGKRVAVVDDCPLPGGQIWRNRGETPPSRDARRWLERLQQAKTVLRFQKTRVVANPAPGTLLAEGPEGAVQLRWTSLILATGSRELFLPFPGWTTPGVFGAGAIQALVKSGLPVKGKRIVVAGTGPLLLAVAELLRAKGADVPMMVEQAAAGRINRFALSLLHTPAKLLAGITLRAKLLGTRYATDSYVSRVTPIGDGLTVIVRTPSGELAVECDHLACGFNLIPNNELPQLLACELDRNGFVQVDGQLRSSVENIFAIGELTGVGGVEKALLEGRIAAHNACGDVASANGLAKAHRAMLAFMRRLDNTFALRPELMTLAGPDTIICRCEDVTIASVRNSINARDAKLQTRCGMGPCQGRVCGPALQRIFGTEPQQVRAPVFVTSIGTLAATRLREETVPS